MRRVFMIVKVLVVVLALCACVSCDRGVGIFPGPTNFAWSECPAESLDTHVDGHFYGREEELWAVLRWKGSALRTGEDVVVLLCLKETTNKMHPVYQLDHGLLVLTRSAFTKDQDIEGRINRLRVLDKKWFSCETCSRGICLTYNGLVFGKSNRSEVTDEGTDRLQLRFEVNGRKNRTKVFSIVKGLYPLLEKEKDAQGILVCLAPLLEE